MVEKRLPAAIAWASDNRIDTPIFKSAARRLCIVTVGKAHQDLMQALSNLGIGEDEAQALGLSLYKVAMNWPLATEPLLAFAQGADEIFVVEEKAPTVENQIRPALFHRAAPRIRVTGKSDAEGKPLLPVMVAFTPLTVAKAGRPNRA